MHVARLLLIVLAACGGPRYRAELVGHGNGILSTVVSAGGGGIQMPQGNYEVAMRFDVPRAHVVGWRIVCPGVDIDGQVGEAEADAGRRTLVATARVITAGDGVCALRVSADRDVRATYTITRIRDLDSQQRMQTIATRESAVKARDDLSAQLVTAGADPAVRQAKVTDDPQQRARADLRARLEWQAFEARQEYLAYLAGQCNAEPGGRDRATEDERTRREARLMAYAEIAQRRDQAALRARSDLRVQLLALGAKARPPMPEPKPEEPGTAPFERAEWTAGYWSWESGEWAWQDGGWTDPALFDEFDYGYYAQDVANMRKHEDGNYHPPTPGVRDHRRPREKSRDHRETSDSSRSWLDTAKDKAAGKSSGDSPKVRDHRSGDDRRTWVPKDADDDKKKDDDKPIVRDHRR
jgi:hypothetical protein